MTAFVSRAAHNHRHPERRPQPESRDLSVREAAFQVHRDYLPEATEFSKEAAASATASPVPGAYGLASAS